MPYLPRVVDAELDELMADLPAIALEGAKGVGKTASASRRAHIVFDLDDERERELFRADPERLDRGSGTVLIDEWQRHPPVWDAVRRRVDAGAAPGRFLLAGSAAPVDAPRHSGAGRIVSVRMRPLALSERGLAAPSVSLAAMLSGARPLIEGRCTVDLPAYVEEILASGFPWIRSLGARARRAQLDGYLDRVVEHDFPEQGVRVRRPATLRAWLAAYAAASSTTATYARLLDAATAGQADKPAASTTLVHRDVLTQLWLLDPVPGWVPGRNHLQNLIQAPKHQLADPALAARLLGIGADALLQGRDAGPPVPRDGTLLGHLFESLVALSVRVYAQAGEATVHHLRTQNGRHEVDLVVARADQRVVAFEVKLGQVPDADAVRHLMWLRDRLGPDLLDAAVITSGKDAYRRPDGIAVIPAALLGP